MKKLQSVLSKYTQANLADLGGAKAKASPLDLEKLGPQLQEVVRRNNIFFVLCVAMILVLFAANITIVLLHHDNLKLVAGTSGIFGISAAGLIVLMTKLWREKVATELVLGLLPALEPAIFRTVITTLIHRLN
jgi:hypothetical protein